MPIALRDGAVSGDGALRTLSGEEVEVSFVILVHRDSAGAVQAISAAARDLRNRRAAERQQKLLMRELDHRVKNTLAIVQALASQTSRFTPDPESFTAAFSARLHAVARAHNVLTQGGWTGGYLSETVEVCFAPYKSMGSCIVIDGPQIRLEPTAVLPLTLILHELATNAAKHGALKNAQGSVALTWRVDEAANQLTLQWLETGGEAVNEPVKAGFGSLLLKSLAKQLRGDAILQFGGAGVSFELVIPLKSNAVPIR